MRIIALLSWYDESAVWLAELTASLGRAGVDHVVAVDGAYAAFPGGKPRSPTYQAATVMATAHGAGMGTTIHTPDERWFGNEVEKRTFLFRAAHLAADVDDWLFIVDADDVVTRADALRATLEAAADYDTAEVTVWERDDPHVAPHYERAAVAFDDWPTISRYPVRKLYRAQASGIEVGPNHYVYRTGDGRLLWAPKRFGDAVPAVTLDRVEVEHRSDKREAGRRNSQTRYYKLRDEMGFEPSVPA